MDKFSKLKAAALAATPGPWGINRTGNTIVSNQSHPVATVSDAFHRQLAGGGVGKDAEFIAAANPDVVLELLAERDSNQQNYQNAMEELRIERSQRQAADQRIAELEVKLATPVRLPRTLWYEHDDLPHEIPVLEKKKVVAEIRAAGFKVEGDE